VSIADVWVASAAAVKRILVHPGATRTRLFFSTVSCSCLSAPCFWQLGIVTEVSVAGAAAGMGVLVPKATAPASLCVQYPKGMAFRRVRGVRNLKPAGIQSLYA